MEKIITILSACMLVLIFSCSCHRKEISTFDYNRFRQDSALYLEQFSDSLWVPYLDSLVKWYYHQDPIRWVKKKYGSAVEDVNYSNRNFKVLDHNVFLVRYGEEENLCVEKLPIECDISFITMDLLEIPECILEDYTWEIEPDITYSLIYLQKGKERKPIYGWYYNFKHKKDVN